MTDKVAPMSSAPPPDASWLLPLGRSLGPREDGTTHDVLAGRVVHALDPVAWLVWSLSHGLPGAAAPWTVADLELQTTASGLPDTPAVLGDLLDRGLVVAVDPADAELLGRVRAVVQLPALGNSAAEPEVWTLGTPEVPLVHLDRVTFDVVTSAHRFPDLAGAVAWAAGAADRAGLPAGAGADPAEVAARVRGALPLLLAVGAVHLELVTTGAAA